MADIKIDDITKTVEDMIASLLPDESRCPSDIAGAMNYSMTAGGKRIRPVLMYLTYMAMASEEEALEDSKTCNVLKSFVAAIEMIHTHSLIHDDLPALDNDTLRRGKPTVHVQYNESTAILAGDALLNFAYETVSKSIAEVADENGDAEAAKVLIKGCKALKVLLSKTGVDGMLGGQGLDVQLSGSRITDEQRDYIYKNKTCALIEAPLMIGAILSGAEDGIISKMEETGEAVGMAFQVQDDILDTIGDSEKLGKEVHQDERNLKNTFVTQYGIEKSKEYVKAQSKKAVEIIENTVPDNKYRRALVELVIMLTDREY